MGNTVILLQQIAMMVIYMMIGLVLFRTKLVTLEGSDSLSNLLLYIVLPAAVINSFCIEHTPQRLRVLLAENAFGPIVAHAPYIMNPCSKDEGIRGLAERMMGEDLALMERLPGWGLQAISSHKDFEKVFGRRADKKRPPHRGRPPRCGMGKADSRASPLFCDGARLSAA